LLSFWQDLFWHMADKRKFRKRKQKQQRKMQE